MLPETNRLSVLVTIAAVVVMTAPANAAQLLREYAALRQSATPR